MSLTFPESCVSARNMLYCSTARRGACLFRILKEGIMLRAQWNVGCGSGACCRGAAKRPFTLIELLVVMSLIIFLMGLLVAGIVIVNRRVGRTQCMAIIKEVSLALDNYKKKVGYYPPPPATFATSVKDYAPLMMKKDPNGVDFTDFLPNFEKLVAEGVLREVGTTTVFYELCDSYGAQLYYQAPGIHNRTSFDLCSAGPDGDVEEEADNINNWDQ